MIKNNLKYLLPLGVFLWFATSAQSNGDVKPSPQSTLIRVYCFYVPNDKLDSPPEEQIRAKTYIKLMTPESEGKESYKIMAEVRPDDFAIAEDDYNKLSERCQTFVKDKGQLLTLKGTRADRYETLSRFSPVTMVTADSSLVPEEQGKHIIVLDNKRIRDELGIDLDAQQDVSSVFTENTEDIKRIAHALKHLSPNKVSLGVVHSLRQMASDLGTTIKNVTTHEMTTTTLTIAAILAAAWFGPAYVATAVDLLYPLVYGAIWGIPSKWGLTYWLVYHPSKVHAVAWAYNHAGPIISVGALMLGTLYKGYQNFINRDIKKEFTVALRNIADKLEDEFAQEVQVCSCPVTKENRDDKEQEIVPKTGSID